MKPATRFGLLGIGGLCLLSLVHWLRDAPAWRPLAGDYLLGVIPNFAAAIAICFVLLGIWADHNREANFARTRRAFILCSSVSGFGLLAWELVQRSSERFVFDPHDVGATLAGIAAASLLFFMGSPRSRVDYGDGQ